ncbi:hypothetical protein [Streptomyces triticiradicis]|uniref:hypothetical protein n=1 Tax=Streptomyces triticiradicis TaxID=2651189 RepID=UPI001788CF3C|nr:hypothetical protein [Streptomyces triticiradicis]
MAVEAVIVTMTAVAVEAATVTMTAEATTAATVTTEAAATVTMSAAGMVPQLFPGFQSFRATGVE